MFLEAFRGRCANRDKEVRWTLGQMNYRVTLDKEGHKNSEIELSTSIETQWTWR